MIFLHQIHVSSRSLFLRRGLTLVEVLVVLAIVGIIAGLGLAAIQRIRESSRQLSCSSNLRQLALAESLFQSSHGRFPPGTVGKPEAVEWKLFRNTPGPSYWKNFQHTSFLVLLLPFMEGESTQQLIDPRMVNLERNLSEWQIGLTRPADWFGEVSGFQDLAESMLPLSRCPSDNMSGLANSVRFTGGSQPVLHGGIQTDAFSYVQFLDDLLPLRYYGTNYGACSGAMSGGVHPDPERARFTGVMSSGYRVRRSDVEDGLSNTIMFGETLGEIENGKRLVAQPTIVGGLIRGRGKTRWLSPEDSPIGNYQDASMFGFGSPHEDVVNVALSDGSTQSLNVNVDWFVFYGLCGRSDATGSGF